MLLAGFILTLVQGIEGRLILRPGQTAETILVTHRSNLTLLSRKGGDAKSIELGFSPGPADWRSDQPLDFGEVDGMGIKVLRFYRHARYRTECVADETGQGKPAIQVALSDSPGGEASGTMVCARLFRQSAGCQRTAPFDSSKPRWRRCGKVFSRPPSMKAGSRGVLDVHYKDHVYPVAVDGNIGKKLPVGESPLSVEIVEYYANSKSSKGQFSSDGAEPKNPMLRLHVHVPGQKEPISEIAYANQPLVNFESLKKQNCPVKFWYHHPAVAAPAGAEFLQTPDGKLYCRVAAGGVYQPRGEVKVGERIAVSADRRVLLLRYIPHSRFAGVFTPVELDPGEKNQAEAAALVELTTGDKSEQFWLGRNDARLGIRRLQTPGGPLLVMFGYERRPLGFSAKLVGFRRDTDPDSASNASCASQLYLSESPPDSDAIPVTNPPREVSTGHPLRYGTFTFYQSGFQQLPHKVDLSVLRVTSDPGRFLKYSGGAMVCLGILLMIVLRASSAVRTVLHPEHTRSDMTSSPCPTSVSPTIRRWAPWPLRWLASLKLAVILLVVLAAVAAVATFVEVAKGRDYVLWYVYHSPWFTALLGVLGVNVLAAAIVRFRWKAGQVPFLVTHAGLLVLLAGALWTFRDGIEGRLVLGEGAAADRIVLSDRCQFIAQWTEGQGRPDRWPAAFVFSPGPVDRREGQALDLGQGSGVHLKLIGFYRHADRHDDWVADDSGKMPPALKIAVAEAGGAADEGSWLAANPFRPEATMGHIRCEFQRAAAASMLEDFLKPPEKDMDPDGVLSVHYAGRVRRIPVAREPG